MRPSLRQASWKSKTLWQEPLSVMTRCANQYPEQVDQPCDVVIFFGLQEEICGRAAGPRDLRAGPA